VSKHQYAFGRLESRRDQVRSVIVPRRLKGLLGALGGAVLLAIFAAIAFALMERGPPPSAKPLERSAGIAERPAAKAMGASSRSKTDIRQPRAAVQPSIRRVDPPPEASIEQRDAQTEPRAALSSPAPAAVPDPVRAPASETARAIEPQPVIEPQRAIEPRREVTGSAVERAETPAEYKPKEEAVWPVVPTRGPSKLPDESKSGAPTDCLPAALQAVLRDLEARFGSVTIVSTTHLNSDNHTAGTIRDKLHQACKAVDIRANHDPKEVIAFLKSRPEVGGINSYRNRLVHFDLDANYKAAANERTEAAASGRAGRR
jgi:hypothetical protein